MTERNPPHSGSPVWRPPVLWTIPLAGYCAHCHRPATRLVVFPAFRHVVHRDGTSCRLPQPPQP